MNALLLALMALNPIGFSIKIGFGVPSGPVASQVIGANYLAVELRAGDDRWFGTDISLVSMSGIAAEYNVGYTGIGPAAGISLGKFNFSGKLNFGQFKRQFSEASERGFETMFGIEGGINILESSNGELSLGLGSLIFPSGHKTIVVYGINLQLLGLIWR